MSRVGSWFPQGMWTVRPDDDETRRLRLQKEIQADPNLKRAQRRLDLKQEVQEGIQSGEISQYDIEQGAAVDLDAIRTISSEQEAAQLLTTRTLGSIPEQSTSITPDQIQPLSIQKTDGGDLVSGIDSAINNNREQVQSLIKSGELKSDGTTTVFTKVPKGLSRFGKEGEAVGVLSRNNRKLFDAAFNAKQGLQSSALKQGQQTVASKAFSDPLKVGSSFNPLNTESLYKTDLGDIGGDWLENIGDTGLVKGWEDWFKGKNLYSAGKGQAAGNLFKNFGENIKKGLTNLTLPGGFAKFDVSKLMAGKNPFALANPVTLALTIASALINKGAADAAARGTPVASTLKTRPAQGYAWDPNRYVV